MRLTILGRYAPYAGAGGACSGYLLREGDTAILLEGGNGVLSRLQQEIELDRLTAVVVSHLHNDHIADLHGLRYAIMALRRWELRPGPITIYAPPEPREDFAALASEGDVEVRALDPQSELRLGPLRFRFTLTKHPIPCLAMRITNGERSLFFSGDTASAPHLVELARGVDLALLESSLDEAGAERRVLGHLTARDAAALAHDAQAKRLLLTHLWPGHDPEQLRREAQDIYPAAEVAQEGWTYTI